MRIPHCILVAALLTLAGTAQFPRDHIVLWTAPSDFVLLDPGRAVVHSAAPSQILGQSWGFSLDAEGILYLRNGAGPIYRFVYDGGSYPNGFSYTAPWLTTLHTSTYSAAPQIMTTRDVLWVVHANGQISRLNKSATGQSLRPEGQVLNRLPAVSCTDGRMFYYSGDVINGVSPIYERDLRNPGRPDRWVIDIVHPPAQVQHAATPMRLGPNDTLMAITATVVYQVDAVESRVVGTRSIPQTPSYSTLWLGYEPWSDALFVHDHDVRMTQVWETRFQDPLAPVTLV